MPERLRKGLPKGLRGIYEVLEATIEAGGRHELALYAPAIAYALVISLAPVTIALNLLGAEALRPSFGGTGLPDVTSEELYGGVLEWAGAWSSLVVLALVLFGASTFFSQLVRAIGRIWADGRRRGGLRFFVRSHLLGFALFITAAIGLFASAIVGNVVTAAMQLLDGEIGLDFSWLSTLVGSKPVVDLVFASLLLTVAYTAVPRTRPKVADVLPGVLLTSTAYAVGQWGLSVYLASAARFSALGAFGALLAFLVWAYYTAAIILWGAELTYQIARRRACARGGADAEPYFCEAPADLVDDDGPSGT